MEQLKKNSIEAIVDEALQAFAKELEERHIREVDDPNGVINRKRNNCFVATLGDEFMFYSAFVRSFDSSFGRVLETMGNRIAALSFTTQPKVTSFLLPQQSQHIDYMMGQYEAHAIPSVSDYNGFQCMMPVDTRSYAREHLTDHYFFKETPEGKTHYLIELKAGGDLDNKKAKTEKIALLQEYFILKNRLRLEQKQNENIVLYFATSYNMFGEGNPWNQGRVKQFFAEKELLIGRDYWNFVCDDPEGFDIVLNRYRNGAAHILAGLNNVKHTYFARKENEDDPE